ncbi:MAG: cation:dicarboxylase symporter family transporter [Candidatus Paracaedibacteraceae bacterium]|nr:cation:dicarboxylase symporter family transporter [Candidatus Paracaedibacteraceae bacterium]
MRRILSTALLSTPIQLVCIVILVSLFASHLPAAAVQSAYTLSVLIKDLLLIVLPIAVASYIASTLISFRQNALLLIVTLLVFEAFSNATSVMYAYTVGISFEHWIPVFKEGQQNLTSLTPYFTINAIRPSFWSSTNGVIIGTAIGIIGAFCTPGFFSQTVFKTRELMGIVFSRIFMRLIPFYVLGFLLFMHHSGLLNQIVESYTTVILMVTATILAYQLILIAIASEFNKARSLSILNNLSPAVMVAFTSMSSAATMPFTITATEKNLKDPKFASMLIPATTNIQQIGDCIANALLCLVILKNFGKPIPDIWSWLPFLLSFTLVRFTTAAVLGGAIFIMIPLYEYYLGFTPEMVALIIALNVVLDPIITSTNVLGNGILSIIFERVWLFISRSKIDEPIKAAALTIEHPFTREEAKSSNK